MFMEKNKYCVILLCMFVLSCVIILRENKNSTTQKAKTLNEFFFSASEKDTVDKITQVSKMSKQFADYEMLVDSYIYDKDNYNAYIKIKVKYTGDKRDNFNIKSHFLENNEDIVLFVRNGVFWNKLNLQSQDCIFETDSYYIYYHLNGFDGSLKVKDFSGEEWEIKLESTCNQIKKINLDGEKSIVITPITIAIEINNIDFVMTDEKMDSDLENGIDSVKIGYENGKIETVMGSGSTYSKMVYDRSDTNDIVRIDSTLVFDVENVKYIEINGIKYS